HQLDGAVPRLLRLHPASHHQRRGRGERRRDGSPQLRRCHHHGAGQRNRHPVDRFLRRRPRPDRRGLEDRSPPFHDGAPAAGPRSLSHALHGPVSRKSPSVTFSAISGPGQMSVPDRSPFHFAVFVPNLGETSLGALSPLNPAFPSLTMPVYSRRGVGELTLGARRVRTSGPSSFTVAVEQSSCDFIRPNAGNRWHHLAFLSDDLDADVSRLEEVGYVREVWAED